MYKIHRHLDLKLDKNHRESLHALLRMFNICKKDVYLVGGCVRDALLDKEPKDIDLTTNATPEEMLEINRNYSNGEWSIIETGLKHGTVTFYNNVYKASFEVTTFRTDTTYSDHRHPDAVVFSTSLEEDLKRRDLTINSFAYDYNKHELHMLDESYLYDLEIGIIRCVGDAEKRFEEDALRIMRAARFAAQLGFSLDSSTYAAMEKLASTIKNVSHERIRDELSKILMSDYPQMLEFLKTSTVLNYIDLDIVEHMMNEPQHNKYHYTDVYHHTMDVVKAVPKDFELRWAAFFHDWGKMSTKSIDDEGWHHYYGHPEVSEKLAIDFMTKYKFDNTSIANISKLVKYHDVAVGADVKMPSFKKTLTKIGEELFPKFLLLTKADRLAHVLTNTKFSVDNLASANDKYKKLKLTPQPMRIRDLAINGNDLVAYGLVGKEIGLMLNNLLEAAIENPEINTKEKLLLKVDEICNYPRPDLWMQNKGE